MVITKMPDIASTNSTQIKSADTLSLQHPNIADSTVLATDTLSISVAIPPMPQTGKTGNKIEDTIGNTSLILSLLIVLFVLVCLRFSKNYRYIKTLLKELTEVRQRNNLFDDTIRESSFLFLLNTIYVVAIAIIFHESLTLQHTEFAYIPILTSFGICLGISMLYVLWQFITYHFLGNLFSDRQNTSMWVKGSTTSQALGGVILFPLAMICIFYPTWLSSLTIIGIIVFILAKLIFIFKGFRIFFAHSSSLMIFLYYLCSVEIIPIIFCYLGAIKICELCI